MPGTHGWPWAERQVVACMNYLELLNAFYERVQCSQVSNNGQLLYHTLLMINNKSSWSDWFSRTNVSISSMMHISEKAFINARSELKQLGLIDFVPSKKRGECTKYRILYPTKYSTKEGTNASTKGGTKEVQTTVQSAVQSAGINKLKQKTKTEKSISDDILEKCGQNAGGDAFQEALGRYLAHLEAIGKPMSGPGLEALLKRLEELAPGAPAVKAAILDQSARNRWRDVWPLKGDGGRDPQAGGRKPNRFHNFDQSGTDYDALAAQKLKERMGGGCNG